MTMTDPAMRNGVDTATLFATLDAVRAQPEAAAFTFRVSDGKLESRAAVVSITVKPSQVLGNETTRGYRMVASDGGVFTCTATSMA